MNVLAMPFANSGPAKTAVAHVSAGARWGAVASGLGVLVLLYLVAGFWTHHWSLRKLLNGLDDSGSTSKLQWFLWLIVVIFAYMALWVLRAEQSDLSSLSKIPVNVLTVLGFSTGTAAVAKGITSGYVQTGKVVKTPPPAGAAAKDTGGILQDDSGAPELAKIQLMGFTIIAIGIYLATVIHQIVTNDISAGLPDIDSSLMVLMGISQGGYLGKKLVTFNTPTVYTPNPAAAAPGATVTLPGANFGTAAGQLTMNGAPVPTTSWSATSIGFAVPDVNPADGTAWTLSQVVPLVVSIMGQSSDPVNLTVRR